MNRLEKINGIVSYIMLGIVIVSFLVFGIFFIPRLGRESKERWQIREKTIGKEIVINKDTLTVVSYQIGGFGHPSGFMLSNGVIVDEKLVKSEQIMIQEEKNLLLKDICARLPYKNKQNDIMKEIKFYPGSSIESAWEMLLTESIKEHDTIVGIFNGMELRSTDTLDEAYIKVLGKTKAEHDEDIRKWREEYDRKKEEHIAQIPYLTKKYRDEARGLIIEEQYDYWDEIVPIRLNDLYEGMELDATLDICRIMRDETVSLDERIDMAKKAFDNQGHSGMSAGLVLRMIKAFCPHGNEIYNRIKF